MGHSSILGADHAPTQAPGRDSGALGPSDSSDSGSDVRGELNLEESHQHLSDLHTPPPLHGDTLHESELASDSDAAGTGERATAVEGEHVREAGDITPDRIVSAGELSGPPSTQDWQTSSAARGPDADPLDDKPDESADET